jgi:hypothetical protein
VVGRTWERNLYENEITIFFGGGGRGVISSYLKKYNIFVGYHQF